MYDKIDNIDDAIDKIVDDVITEIFIKKPAIKTLQLPKGVKTELTISPLGNKQITLKSKSSEPLAIGFHSSNRARFFRRSVWWMSIKY